MRRFVVWMYAPHAHQWSIPSESLERIREALGPGWEVASVEVALDATGDGARTAPPPVLDAIVDAEVFCGWGIRPEAFAVAKKLRWFHSGAAGVRASLFDAMRESDVIFTNSADMYSEPLAEHALAGMLYFARGLDVAARTQRERHWAQVELTGPESPLLAGVAGEIGGATLGIIGYGGIGSALGRRASALGMRVQAIRRTPGALPPELERIEGPAFLPELLRTSDYVALTAPETPETRQLLDAERLALLEPTAVLINLARGSMVDEDALAKALMERRLRGAALDVFQTEPLPADHPLWDLENVLITPHVGGTSGRFWERETELIVRNVRRYLAGEELENRVDKERGY
ncbi:MAG: D-2-hydroxyacid dehydrogenase [Gemmatimonadetes bacterium]|nr:D-2-hydroxyacid dehydrogenase [Gemmatimonadota bacterium]